MTDTKPTLEMLIEYQSQLQGIDKWQDGVFDSLKQLAAIKSQPVPVEPTELTIIRGLAGNDPIVDYIDSLQSALQVAQQELAALPEWKRRRSEEWRKIGEALNGKISDVDSLKIRLRELDEKGYQPSTGAIGNEAADCIDAVEQRAEKADARNKRLVELLRDIDLSQQGMAGYQLDKLLREAGK